MATVTAGSERFSGTQASVTDAALVGVTGVDLRVTGTAKLNNTSRSDGERIGGDSATSVPSTPSNLLPTLAIDLAQQLSVVAGGSLNIGLGAVVAVIPAAGLTLELAKADVVTGNATLGTLTDAQLLAFAVTGASLFVGRGGSLSGDRSSVVTSGATGFSVGSASFDMGSVTSGSDRFTGIQASVTDA